MAVIAVHSFLARTPCFVTALRHKWFHWLLKPSAQARNAAWRFKLQLNW